MTKWSQADNSDTRFVDHDIMSLRLLEESLGARQDMHPGHG
jgi:hypothetical protein